MLSIVPDVEKDQLTSKDNNQVVNNPPGPSNGNKLHRIRSVSFSTSSEDDDKISLHDSESDVISEFNEKEDLPSFVGKKRKLFRFKTKNRVYLACKAVLQ